MPVIYPYTRDPYTQIASWPGYTILPKDGDPFVALSAQLYEKSIQDRNMYIWEGALKNVNSNGAVRMYSTDGLSVTVYPFICQIFDDPSGQYKTIVYDKTTVITAANLLVPGTFDPDTWYPIYLQYLGSDQTRIIIDNTGNLQYYLLYRELVANIQDKAFKYLGSFLTDGASAIYPYFKDGIEVRYLNAIRVLEDGQEIMDTAIPLAQWIPPFARMVHLSAHLFNGDIVGPTNFIQFVSNLFPGVKIVMPNDSIFQRFLHNSQFTYNLDATQTLYYHWDVSGVNVSNADLDLLGYRE